MEKLLLRKVGLIFIGLLVIIFAGFSVIIFSIESKNSINDIEQMIKQVVDSYNENKKMTENTKELLKEDYLNRAYAIEFMLEDNPKENYRNRVLKIIKKRMGVDVINVIDFKGNIVLSSDNSNIGLNLKEHKESKMFWELIDSENIKDYVVQFNGKGIVTKQSRVYVGVKLESKKYSVLQIGVNNKLLDGLTDENTIKNLFNTIPTVSKKALFAVNEESGEIEGITKNNASVLHIDNITSKEEFLKALKSYKNGDLVTINGTKKFIKTVEVDNIIIGGYLEARSVYKQMLFELIFIFFGIAIVLFVVWVLVRYSLRKYVLRDLEFIESNVKELMNGNYNITFGTNYNTEFRAISRVLNDWKTSYRYREERMTRIIASIDSHVAIFECLYSINQTFFSDNMQSILGLGTEEWTEISQTPYSFENYINTCLDTLKKGDGVLAINQRFVSVVSFHEKEEFYGVVIDRTEEMKEKNKFKQELYDIQVESETDGLTRVMNRTGVEKNISNALEREPQKGVMLIFDLDNFKAVNDNRGHCEGDEVLKKFAFCLRQAFRTNDIVGRIGGDEFVVFLNETIEKQCLIKKMESLLEEIHDELEEYYKLYSLSTSIGIVFVEERIYSYKQLYEEADVALYHAKALGKDQFYIREYNEIETE